MQSASLGHWMTGDSISENNDGDVQHVSLEGKVVLI
jgi:hypothetical protein